MGKRRRVAVRHKKANTTKESSGDIPGEIVELLTGYLPIDDVPAARLTCKAWKHNFSSTLTSLELNLDSDMERNKQRLKSVLHTLPLLQQLTLLLGVRVTTPVLAAVIADLSQWKKLKQLELRFLYPSLLQKGSASPVNLVCMAKLKKITVLKISGGWTPTVESITALKGCTMLKEFELLPGYFQELFQGRPPVTPMDSPPHPYETVPTIPDGALVRQTGANPEVVGALCSLTQLQRLKVRVQRNCTDQGLLQAYLQDLGRLKKLTQLEVVGCKMQKETVAELAKSLQELQVFTAAVSDGEALGHITCLSDLQFGPHIRDVGLAGQGGQAPHLDASVFRNLTELKCCSAVRRLHVMEATLGQEATDIPCTVQLHDLSIEPGLRHIGPTPEDPPVPDPFTLHGHAANLGLRSLALNYKFPSMFPLIAPDLPPPSLPLLTSLSLQNVSSDNLPGQALNSIMQAAPALRHLQVHGTGHTYISVDLSLLPSSLETLDLAVCALAANARPLDSCLPLEELKLKACCCVGTAVVAQNELLITIISTFTEIRELMIADMADATDHHIFQIAHHLRHLRSLTIEALGNQYITHISLQYLARLKRLRYLKWNVGDMFDPVPDVTALTKMTSLYLVSMPWTLYTRLQRFNSTNFLKHLPYAEIEMT